MAIKIVKGGKVHDVSLKGLLSMLFGRLLVDEPIEVREFASAGNDKKQEPPQTANV